MVTNEVNKTVGERQAYLDVAKGIGMVLVIWAHAGGPFSNLINSFHMPFFFFVSGMLYLDKGRNITNYVFGKFKSLLAPFLWWNLLLFPVFFLLYYWQNWDIMVFLKGIGTILLTVDKVPFLGATWFLASLFWISIFVHTLVVVFRKYRFCDGVLLVAGILIAVLGFQVTFPFKISRTLICSLFYVIGYLYQKYIRKHICYMVSTGLALAFFMAYIVIASNNAASLASNEYESKMAFIAGALFATYFMLWLSETLVKLFAGSFAVRHMIYLSKHSIDLVIWHLLAFRIAILVQIMMGKGGFYAITAFPVYDATGMWWILYLLTGIYGSLIWKYLLEHNPMTPLLKKFYLIH